MEGNKSENAPDVSAVISMILQNPELVEQLKALGQKAAEAPVDTPPKSLPEAEEIMVAAKPVSAPANEQNGHKWMNGKREHLLFALKPYLSKERAGAIDAAVTFARILDTVHTK